MKTSSKTERSPVRVGSTPGPAGFPVLAHKSGIGLMLGMLIRQGAMCPKCGHGTKATSKRWAVCKTCGERTERRSFPNVKGQPMETPRTNAALDETLKGCGFLKGNVHGPLTDLCRKLECENAELRRALQINADFWASAKSETDAGLIMTMRELCSAALANVQSEPRHE